MFKINQVKREKTVCTYCNMLKYLENRHPWSLWDIKTKIKTICGAKSGAKISNVS